MCYPDGLQRVRDLLDGRVGEVLILLFHLDVPCAGGGSRDHTPPGLHVDTVHTRACTHITRSLKSPMKSLRVCRTSVCVCVCTEEK